MTDDSKILVCDDETRERFLKAFGIARDLAPTEMAQAIARAFVHLPYENLTKILKHAEAGSASNSRRLAKEVVGDHFEIGAGGTCFALTAAMVALLRSCGVDADPLLADRSYGPDTHSAVLVRLDGQPYLLDPGYLLTTPMPFSTDAQRQASTAFHDVLLQPKGAEKIELSTLQSGQTTPRLVYRTAAVEPDRFARAWDASFDWEMMTYPVLTRVSGDRQYYLRGRRRQSRSKQGVDVVSLTAEDLPERIQADFGLDPALAARALTLLRRRGWR